MQDEVFVGLDVHKATTVATVLDREGIQVDQTTLRPNEKANLRGQGRVPMPH